MDDDRKVKKINQNKRHKIVETPVYYFNYFKEKCASTMNILDVYKRQVEACTISEGKKMSVATFSRKSNGDHIFLLSGCAALRF